MKHNSYLPMRLITKSKIVSNQQKIQFDAGPFIACDINLGPFDPKSIHSMYRASRDQSLR